MKANTFRIHLPQRGFGCSMSNMIQILSGEASALKAGDWIDVTDEGDGRYVVCDENLTVKNGYWLADNVALDFAACDDEVVDMDNGGSDESQCFGISSHLSWREVDLTPEEFHSPSFELLVEAFQHIAVCAWCPGDI